MNEGTLKARNDLASYFRSKAKWRLDVAEEKCRDGTQGKLKNELYAHKLEKAAKYVESLPDDDTSLSMACGLDLSMADSEIHTSTIHCGFPGDSSPADWLRDWVEFAIEQADEANRKLAEFD